jgi:hypothetical protein
MVLFSALSVGNPLAIIYPKAKKCLAVHSGSLPEGLEERYERA